MQRETPSYSPPHLTDRLSNYSKIAWRNLAKNRAYSTINITGLAIGLACCLTIGLYIWGEYSRDRFHPRGSQIYRVVEQQNRAGTLYDEATTPGPLAPVMKADFAEIAQAGYTGLGGAVSPGLLYQFFSGPD